MAIERIEIQSIGGYISSTDMGHLVKLLSTVRACRRLIDVEVVDNMIVFRAYWPKSGKRKAKP